MTEPVNDQGEQPPGDDKIAALSFGLLDVFGAGACEVVEAQIEAAPDDENRATWIAVWERLCSATARRA